MNQCNQLYLANIDTLKLYHMYTKLTKKHIKQQDEA